MIMCNKGLDHRHKLLRTPCRAIVFSGDETVEDEHTPRTKEISGKRSRYATEPNEIRNALKRSVCTELGGNDCTVIELIWGKVTITQYR